MKRATLIAALLWFGQRCSAGSDVATILKKVSETYSNAKSYHFVGKNETIRDGKADPEENMRIEIAIRRSDRMYLVNPETGEGGVVKRQPMNVDTGYTW